MIPFNEDLQACLKVLQEGGLILYPTDTVWGIGCDATNPLAVQKVYDLKRRADSKALIVLVHEEEQLLQYTDQPNLIIFDYIKGLHKPTTVIYEKAKNLAHNLIAADGSIGIRVCKDTFCYHLIQAIGKPIVSTSANISGYPTPFCFNDISLDIIEGVDYTVKHRQEEVEMHQPSSIIKWDAEGHLIIIRN